MSPHEFTLRELWFMWRSCETARWDHTCFIVATVKNIVRKKGASAVRPESLNPFRTVRRTSGTPINRETMPQLREELGTRGLPYGAANAIHQSESGQGSEEASPAD